MGECLRRSFASRSFVHLWYSGCSGSSRVIASTSLPEPAVNRVVAMVRDRAVKPSLRVGMAATVQLELNGPPRDNQAFRKSLTDSLNAKLQANGIPPGPGSAASFIVHVEEKDTGRKVDYREFGDPHFNSPRGSIAITNLVCDVQFADS
jgi:hypothetical protein